MKPFVEWSKLAPMLVTIAVGGSAILAFATDIEPWTPVTRAWVREFGITQAEGYEKKLEIQSGELNAKLAAANAETNAKLETLTYQNYDLQLGQLTASLQALKGEELMLQKRLQASPGDALISGRLTEVQANIKTNEQDASALRCEIATRKGWPCGPR